MICKRRRFRGLNSFPTVVSLGRLGTWVQIKFQEELGPALAIDMLCMGVEKRFKCQILGLHGAGKQRALCGMK